MLPGTIVRFRRPEGRIYEGPIGAVGQHFVEINSYVGKVVVPGRRIQIVWDRAVHRPLAQLAKAEMDWTLDHLVF